MLGAIDVPRIVKKCPWRWHFDEWSEQLEAQELATGRLNRCDFFRVYIIIDIYYYIFDIFCYLVIFFCTS